MGTRTLRRLIAGLFCAGLAFVVAGCVILPIPTGQESHRVFKQSDLDELIGSDRSVVEAHLGKPYAKFGDSNDRYLIYAGGFTYEYFDLVAPVTPPQVFIPYWLIVAATVEEDEAGEYRDHYEGDTYCYLFHLDSEDILRRFELKKEPDLDCESAFFSPEQLKSYAETREELRLKVIYEDDPEAQKNLIKWFGEYDVSPLDSSKTEPVSEDILLIDAKLGNAGAQWELYERRKLRGEHDFEWLCRAAEQGDYRAQWELGFLHYYGLHGVRKDDLLSVMWLSLVESGGHDSFGGYSIRKSLTPEQLAAVEHLLKNWKTGRCEREIFGTEPSDSN
jgi:hypothetical protein